MVFSSLHFPIFFAVVTVFYFAFSHQFRWVWLLVASCYFYMAFIPIYILILAFTIAVDYLVALKLESIHGRSRKWMLAISLVANVGVLAVFKYYYFLTDNMAATADFFGWNYSLPALSIILPLGLSFHTFQSMSYIIEVYRGNQPAERNLGIFALYVMYYPQLVAGPIERPQNLLNQLREPHTFDYVRVRDGLKLMLWGMFKKVAIADQIAVTVDMVYGNPGSHTGLTLIFATVLFGIQIYADFSGYSDIAIGASKVMGIDLMRNFRQPYFSRSISEFWRRWHISLSTWFRDYLYIPLGGRYVPQWRRQLNLFAVFLVSGLWHGASWVFVIWGALHGLYLMTSLWTAEVRFKLALATKLDRMPVLGSIVAMVSTFTLVTFAWIFFRAETLPDAFYIVTHLFDGLYGDLVDLQSTAAVDAFLSALKISKYTLLAILVLIAADIIQEQESLYHWTSQRPAFVRWSLYYGLGLWILLTFTPQAKQFIYFQF